MQSERNGFGVGNPPGRPNSNENSREKRDKGGECEHVDVDLGFVKPRHRRRGERKNRIETPDREQNTGDRTDYCNQCALDQKLACDRLEIAVRPFHADSGFQPAESPKALMIITAQHARMVCDFVQRQQHIWISAELKLSRKYADYLTFQSIN